MANSNLGPRSALSDEDRLRQDVGHIVEALCELLQQESGWNGEVSIESRYSAFSGVARYDGTIGINEIVNANSDERWRTLLHESLHTFSTGLNRADYARHRGWEEGAVEQMQRLLRPTVLHMIGAAVSEDVSEDVLLQREASHPYNRYIMLLEGLRVLLVQNHDTFYRRLLRIPLAERPSQVRAWSEGLAHTKAEKYQTAWLKAAVGLSR